MPEPVSRYQGPFLVEVDAGGLPVAQLGGVGAALVAARDEGRLGRFDRFAQAFEDVLAGRLGRVGLGADDDEVVVHDFLALDAEALGDELLLGGLVMHEDDVGIAAARHVERLAGAQGDHAHLDAAGLLEGRQQVAEEAGLLGRGGRRHGDEALLGLGQAGQPEGRRPGRNRTGDG
jgi:hypothetical protein